MTNTEAIKCYELLLESKVYTKEELDIMDDVKVRVKFFEHFHILSTNHIEKGRRKYYYILKTAMSDLMCEKKAFKDAFKNEY